MKFYNVLIMVAMLSNSLGSNAEDRGERSEERREERGERREDRRDNREDRRDDRRENREDRRDDRRDNREDRRDERRDNREERREDRHDRREDRREDRHDRRDDRRDHRWDYDHGHHGDYYYGESSCSPQLVEKNMNILESTVNKLAASKEFANAQDFQKTIARIQAERNMSTLISSYCALVGVDANDPKQVVEFLGAREHNAYVAHAQRTLNLNAQQANMLVDAITENLLNGINN